MLQRVLATKFVHLGPVKEKEQQRLREGRNGGRPLTSQKPGRSYIYPFAQGIMDPEVQRVLSAFLLPKYGHIHFIEGEYSTGRVDHKLISSFHRESTQTPKEEGSSLFLSEALE